jgi:hypothetical protein
MRKCSFRLVPTVILLSLAPLGCGDGAGPSGSGGSGNGGASQGGSGGTASGGSSGGTTSAGGSGGTTTSTGGGGVATGGATGGSGGSGGNGGSAGAGGGPGGRGGTTNATGGSNEGGSGGSVAGGGGETSVGGEGGGNGGDPGGAGGDSGGAGGSPDGGETGGSTGDAGGPETEPVSCEDKAMNGDETDVDCGGGTCPKCAAGKTCKLDADCRSGSCGSGGKCADPFAPTGTVTNNGNIWKITAGATTLEVDQAVAGKITAFTLDGTNFLVINDASTGSVFWTSPQAEWNANGWPPPEELDTKAYTPSSAENVLTMTGPTGTTGAVTKRFWANVEHQTVTIEYTFKNTTSAAVKKAPWEITRVYPGGLTFFPIASPPVQLPGTCNCFLEIPFTTAGGAAWWKYLKAEFNQDVKGGADGSEGWAAHINCGTGLEKACAAGAKSMVMIKQWADATTEAPGEKEIEIYANAGHNYVEFEQQGDYQSIEAGGTMVWTMHWMLRYLPTDVAPTPGSEALLDWVRSQLL